MEKLGVILAFALRSIGSLCGHSLWASTTSLVASMRRSYEKPGTRTEMVAAAAAPSSFGRRIRASVGPIPAMRSATVIQSPVPGGFNR